MGAILHIVALALTVCLLALPCTDARGDNWHKFHLLSSPSGSIRKDFKPPLASAGPCFLALNQDDL